MLTFDKWQWMPIIDDKGGPRPTLPPAFFSYRSAPVARRSPKISCTSQMPLATRRLNQNKIFRLRSDQTNTADTLVLANITMTNNGVLSCILPVLNKNITGSVCDLATMRTISSEKSMSRMRWAWPEPLAANMDAIPQRTAAFAVSQNKVK